MREIISASESGNRQATLALEVFCYRIRKYIGAYAAAMGGVDAIAFAAGIGENADVVRKRSCQGLEFLGMKLDEEANSNTVGREGRISTDDSKVQLFVVPTNEELVIALDTMRIVQSRPTD
jgi:acetate kinase